MFHAHRQSFPAMDDQPSLQPQLQKADLLFISLASHIKKQKGKKKQESRASMDMSGGATSGAVQYD